MTTDTQPIERMRITSAGNVGIGTTSPGKTLDIIGDLGLKYAASGTSQLHMGTNTINNGSGYIYFLNSNGVKNWKISTNDVISGALEFTPTTAAGGSAWDPPTMYLTAGAGTVSFGAWTYNSDRRLKENIAPLIGGLAAILALRPKQFDYINGGKNQLGFIAQDVQAVIPQAVEVANPKSGMLGLKTEFIIPHLVKGMQELDQKIQGIGRANTAAVQPACAIGMRGTFWVVRGGAGVKDTVQICAKDAADAYAWCVLY